MTQLERLARPFPAKYVRQPAQGKYGEYVPHHVVTQALLAIVGPFDLHIGEVFYGGEKNLIEGCLVTVVATIDGRRVSVTEIGDCEQPTNWKTQGARMKDAISDGVKRCAARLGCGLHLYSGSDFFLYEQLRQQDAEVGQPQVRGPSPVDGFATPATSATSLAGQQHEFTSAVEAGELSPSSKSKGSKARRERLKSRCVALQADGVSVADAREAEGLPLVDSCDDEQLTNFEALVFALEAELTAPFEAAK